MSVFESIAIGEDWISEHFFTTTGKGAFRASVVDRVKEWAEAEANGQPTVRTRFSLARQALLSAFAAMDEAADNGVAAQLAEVHQTLLDVLGYVDGRGLRVQVNGPLVQVYTPGVEKDAPLVVVLANPVETAEDVLVKDAPTLGEPVQLTEDGEAFTSAARLLSALFTSDEAPSFTLVLAGRIALLAEKGRWAEGRYLAVNLQLMAERNDTKKGGEVNTALTCLEARSLTPDAEGGIWWERMLAESVKHTVGVSKDLRDGVRLSIELLAQEVVDRRAAQGLAPLPQEQAQVLARQALRFLYRILFLLYAEASPELEVLPVGAPEYDQGYSLDRLRELVQIPLTTPQSQDGTHLYESLGLLFKLVDTGHTPSGERDLTVNPLRADLFKPEATALIDEVKLGNAALQQVLAYLLLSKETRGKDRGFISYAELGINQLGAVYEGLMSYTGFFAETDLYEVAKGGDGSKGSWVVDAGRIDGISENDFVRRPDPQTGEMKPVLHKKGSFVFRLAGRERQQSASYYTPEVLTRFTVNQALEELITEETTAAEILQMSVCEPALGSGAFAIEATRQLAKRYLSRRQQELGIRIDPDAYPVELQKVKASIALHNVYGVDLNATAVELAEISLWLDTMVSGLAAPWFGLHLRRGNSLIGARRAVYGPSQVSDKSWLKTPATDMPLTSLAEDIEAYRIGGGLGGSIHHFLLPGDDWGAAADAKEAKNLAPDAVKALKAWRSGVKKKPTAAQLKALQGLAMRVERLWQFSLQRLRLAEQHSRRFIAVWGAEEVVGTVTQAEQAEQAVQREQIEASLSDVEGAFSRLRRVMDAWCALWFWPLTDGQRTVNGELIDPPTMDEWIAGLTAVLGEWHPLDRGKNQKRHQEESFSAALNWDELGAAESFDAAESNVISIDQAKANHPWLEVTERIAQRQGFFHWELDFATVFAKGGFDLQVGNPPWVRPDWESNLVLSEFNPCLAIWSKEKLDQSQYIIDNLLTIIHIIDYYLEERSINIGNQKYLSHSTNFPLTSLTRSDLYRSFMEKTWMNVSNNGIVGLIHKESHFSDDKAKELRQESYRRLKRHWHFINRLRLFDIDSKLDFSINIYSNKDEWEFKASFNNYHPSIIESSLKHDGSNPSGMDYTQNSGNQLPHKDRIIDVNTQTLKSWNLILGGDADQHLNSKMLLTSSRIISNTLTKLSKHSRVGGNLLNHTNGWNETNDRDKGRFITKYSRPKSWDSAILKGPHIYVANPLYKESNPNKDDYPINLNIDLEGIDQNFIPSTSYQPSMDKLEIDNHYPSWNDSGFPVPSNRFYRVAWRSMSKPTNERTLISALMCAGTAHINGVRSSNTVDAVTLTRTACFLSSLLLDLVIRSNPKAVCSSSAINRLPIVNQHPLMANLYLRGLRLNCLTEAFSPIWNEVYSDDFLVDEWAGGRERENRTKLVVLAKNWSVDTPLRIAEDRRQALVELDALIAVMFGVTADELCTVYRTQFPVLYGYDRNRDYYDANGRLVHKDVMKAYKAKGDAITLEERTATNDMGNTYTYELPFVTLDREADMRQAHAHFTRLTEQRSSKA